MLSLVCYAYGEMSIVAVAVSSGAALLAVLLLCAARRGEDPAESERYEESR
jgi:hypothetical protein